MKKLLSLFLLLALLILADHITGYCDAPSTILSRLEHITGGRPRIPDGQVVSVRFLNGDITIEFLHSEGDAEVYVCAESHAYERCFDISTSSVQTIETHITSGSIFLSITTDYGNTYIGLN